jgi:SAM-dependent methyltransferase
MTADALADAAGTNRRLTRELLDQQASVGFFSYDESADTYTMVPEAELALADRDSPVYMAGGFEAFQAMFQDLDATVGAFRDERTLGWDEHSPCMYSGVKEFFRPAYLHHLVQEWLPAVDGMHERLTAGAAVVDVGCGEGFSTLQMASAYPNSSFVGVDFHAPSIEVATATASEAGASNVAFQAGNATELEGDYDLVCFFDCLHDMGDPVGVATSVKNLLGEDGVVMLVEPFAMDTRAQNHQALGAMMYGASAMICTPCSLAQPVGRGMGAQAGEPGMRAVFDEAGYSTFERVAETPFNIVYHARV